MICVHFQGKPFNTTVIQVHSSTTNAEEAEAEGSMTLLKLTSKKMSFSSQRTRMQVGIQEIPGVTGKFGLRVQNESE